MAFASRKPGTVKDEEAPLMSSRDKPCKKLLYDDAKEMTMEWLATQVPPIAVDESTVNSDSMSGVLALFVGNMMVVLIYSFLCFYAMMRVDIPAWLTVMLCVLVTASVLVGLGLLLEPIMFSRSLSADCLNGMAVQELLALVWSLRPGDKGYTFSVGTLLPGGAVMAEPSIYQLKGMPILPRHFMLSDLSWENASGETINLLEHIERGYGEGRRPSAIVKELIQDGTIEANGNLRAELIQANYRDWFFRCFNQPAVQAALCCVLWALLSLPAVLYVMKVRDMQGWYCDPALPEPPGVHFLREQPLECEGRQVTTCPEFCVAGKGLVKFLVAMNDRLKVALVEFGCAVPLMLMMIWTLSIYNISYHRRMGIEEPLIARMNGSAVAKQEIRRVRDTIEDYPSFWKSLDRLHGIFKKLRQCATNSHSRRSSSSSSGSSSDGESNAREDEIGLSAGDYTMNGVYCAPEVHNQCFYSVTGEVQKFSGIGDIVETVCMDPPCSSEWDGIVRWWDTQGRKHGISPNSSADGESGSPGVFSKAMIYAPVKSTEVLQLFYDEYFRKPGPAGYMDQLTAIFRGSSGSTAVQDTPAAASRTAIRCGGVVVPSGFALSHVEVWDDERHRVIKVGPQSPNPAGETAQNLRSWQEFSTGYAQWGEWIKGGAKLKFLFQTSAQSNGELFRTVRRHLKEMEEDEPRQLGTMEWVVRDPAMIAMGVDIDDNSSLLLHIRERRSALVQRAFSEFFNVLQPHLNALIMGICLGWLLPLARWVLDEGELFPEAVRWPLLLNTMSIAIPVCMFFDLFEESALRLWLIKMSLISLRNRTRNSRDDIWKDCFRLHDSSAKPCSKSERKRRYARLAQHVEHWTLTQDYIRNFLCNMRLALQAILIAAAAILVVLFMFSLVQSLSGRGMLQVDREELGGMLRNDTSLALDHVRQSAHDLAHQAHEHLQSAVSDVQDAVQSGVESAVGDGGRRLELLGGTAAALALQRALEPFERALRGPLVQQLSLLVKEHKAELDHARRLEGNHEELRQGLDRAGAYLSTVKGVDMSKTTKTQWFLLAFLMFIAGEAIGLVGDAVRVNGHFDEHEHILAEHMSQNVQGQAREEKYKAGAAAEPADGGREGEEHPRGLYEKLLKSAHAGSRRKAANYPLRILGVPIKTGVLLGYIVFAVAPLLQQAQHAAPQVVKYGCSLVEDSWVLKSMQSGLDEKIEAMNAAAETAQQKMNEGLDQASAMLDSGAGASATAKGAKNAEHLVPSIRLKRMIHEAVCKPMVKAVQQQVDKMADKVAEAGKAIDEQGGDGRRLIALPSLGAALRQWWAERPEEPSAKLAQLHQALGELRMKAHQLLLVAPAVVHSTYHSGNRGVAIEVGLQFAH